MPQTSPRRRRGRGVAAATRLFRREARARRRYRFEPARLQRIDRALRDLFEPGLTAGTVVQVLELLAVDHDFLRLGSKRSIPPPVTILTPASRSAAAP